ncbi:hypothetical protein [Ralstonia solanacearum]|nr:hypothetical protein [Ralstonia solanacearum]QOK80699.1 hypothetical protein HF906_00020 [Ralstonia solanacearum]
MKKLTFVQRLVLALIPFATEVIRLAEVVIKNMTANYKNYGTSVGFQI